MLQLLNRGATTSSTSFYFSQGKQMKFLKSFFDSIVEARRRQAAFHTAQYLKETNKDFRDIALGDLANRIMDEKNPTHIDGSRA